MSNAKRLVPPLVVTFLFVTAGALRSAQATGGEGTYECWDRCTTEVSCETSCYLSFNGSNSGPLITCGEYGTCGALPPPPPQTCVNESCTSCARPLWGLDADNDSIADQLEHDLAHRFFPDILLQWPVIDLEQSYLYLGYSIPYMVRPGPTRSICASDGGPNRCLAIYYGVAYINDCGDNLNGWESHSDCDPYGGFLNTNSGHPGDSEFYAALVQRTGSWTAAQADASQWVLIRDFTAAHWGAAGDSSRVGAFSHCSPGCWQYNEDDQGCRSAGGLCSWQPGFCTGGVDSQHMPCAGYSNEPDCFFAGGSCNWLDSACRETTACYSTAAWPGRRTVFAAEAKHGLYHTDSECDNGGFQPIPFASGPDECPNNNLRLRDDQIAGKLQNVGNSAATSSGFDRWIQHPNQCGRYDVWGGLDFGGEDVTSYAEEFQRSIPWGLP
jgi:hypothetical protein